MSATYTVVTLDGKEHQNLDSETVKQWFLQKKLREDSFVMSSETNQWKLLKKVFDITQWFPPTFAQNYQPQPQPQPQTQWQQPMPVQPPMPQQQQWQPPMQQPQPPQQTQWQPPMPQNHFQQTQWQPPVTQPQQQWNAQPQQPPQQQWNNYQQPTYLQPQQPTYSQPQQPTFSQPQQPTYSQPQQPAYSQPQQQFHSQQQEVQAYWQQQSANYQQYQPQPQWVSQNNWIAPPPPVPYGVQNYNAAPARRPGVRAAAVLFFINAAFGLLGVMAGGIASAGGSGAYRAGYGFGGLVALIIDIVVGVKLWKADHELDKYRKIGMWRSGIAFGLSLLFLIPMASTGFGFPLLFVYAMYYGSYILILYGEEPPSQNRVIFGVVTYILSFFFAIGVGIMMAVSAISELR